MKYLLKAISTNTRDMKTAILYSISDKHYLFNCPDCFQRGASSQKMKFKSVKTVFLPSMRPDHFMGFPGFYMSARESNADQQQLDSFSMAVVGPPNMPEVLSHSGSFMGDLSKTVQLNIWPKKDEIHPNSAFKYAPEFNSPAFIDANIKVLPMIAQDPETLSTNNIVYSYFVEPH